MFVDVGERACVLGNACAFCGCAVACLGGLLPSLCLSGIRLGNASMLFWMIAGCYAPPLPRLSPWIGSYLRFLNLG